MLKEELLPLIREFPDRSIQWLLETPDNVRGLLLIVASDLAKRIDYTGLKRINKTFISDDLQKHEADMVFTVPFFEEDDRLKEVIIYILIEHQSSIDPEMTFRVLSYMVKMWEAQRREWISNNVPINQRKFRPILPVVFYTGSREWNSLSDMKQLMDLPKSLEQFVIQPNILFLSLEAMESDRLVEQDHPFGWILRLVQKEDSASQEFEETLRLVVNHLEQMSSGEKANWEKLIWFIIMLIYNRREPRERSDFVKIIEDNVNEKNRKEEISNMGRTIAQELIEEGIEIGTITTKQDALIRLLKVRFGIVSESFAGRIKLIRDVDQLDELFDHAIIAERLDDLDI